MNFRIAIVGLVCAASLCLSGCRNPTGNPSGKQQDTNEQRRPEQVLDFPTLYANNCAGCHGEHGHNGAAISLANPIYLRVAGVANIQHITANGVAGTMMPPFAKSAGGLLTDEQVGTIARGMVDAWGGPPAPGEAGTPSYAATREGDVRRGQSAFVARCASCHGADNKQHTGSVVDPAYLSLISDQGLRSILIAGVPGQDMPDWHWYPMGALTDAEVTDIVTWLGSKRSPTPGQAALKQQP